MKTEIGTLEEGKEFFPDFDFQSLYPEGMERAFGKSKYFE